MKKLTVEECEQISISTLVWQQKYYMFKLKPKWNREYFYSVLAERLDSISLYSLRRIGPLRLIFTSTVPHFGGVRYWFICPHCKRRVGKLYKPENKDSFWCRHCHDLTYNSSQTHNQRVDSLSKKLDDIRIKEGDEALGQTIGEIGRTRRGSRLLGKVCHKRRVPFPPPSSARRESEEKAYDKYVRPLLGD